MSAPGELIAGRYRLRARLGSGGMGVVWEAWDERLERQVAVKQLHPHRGRSPAEAELANLRALREARINARLHHRYAVPVFDVAEHDGQPCLVMQFVPSIPLSVVLRDGGPLAPAEAALVGAQVAGALAAAHAAGIVHRDVKPGNILIADDGSALISDFGISHAMGDATLTETGMVHGTPAYLAPEVARGGSASHASDVFSLGATLYATLEGAPPFGSDPNSIALLHRVATGDFAPPRRSAALAPVLVSMLAGNPADRPTMVEVARTFADLVASGAAPAAVEAPPTPQAGVEEAGPPTTDADPPATEADPPAEAGTTLTRPVPAASPGHASPPSSLRPPRRRRRAGVAAVVAAVVVGLVAALWLAVLRPDAVTTGAPPDPSPSAPSVAAGTAGPSPTDQPSPTQTPTQTPTPTPRSSDGTPTAAELARAVTDYYALMPTGTDEAWPRLTTSYQTRKTGGRQAYERFWGAVQKVTATNVTGKAPASATATITYTYKDGRVARERTNFRFVDDGGTVKINGSSIVSTG